MFWSIISDYDLRTALAELVDNAIDQWLIGRRESILRINVNIDCDTQTILVIDNSGGVPRGELESLVSPGSSGNDPYAKTIGIFGVGSKRAVVALARQVSIKTSVGIGQTFQIDIDEDWLEASGWEIPHYAIPDILPGTTVIDLSRLRRKVDEEDVEALHAHFEQVYAIFVETHGVEITVNGSLCCSARFNNWAYPPEYKPTTALFSIPIEPAGPVVVQLAAGLILDRQPGKDNYGVYIYCNDRLVVKELRTREVGYFVPGEAGVPHPDASLCRVIVEFAGPARHMPWNSNKSGINFEHPVFLATRDLIVEFATRYTRLSRALKKSWEEDVLHYVEGEPEVLVDPKIGELKKLHLPPVPRVRTSHIEHLVEKNEKLLTETPWILGLIESIGMVDVVMRQRAETRTRIALILLDSCLEIGFKEFIVHDFSLSNANLGQLFNKRSNVITHIQSVVSIDAELLRVSQHYYAIRNKLIHERATISVTDRDIETYRGVVTEILTLLFSIKF